MKVYPVPASGKVTVEVSEFQNGLTVEVYNLQGTRVYSGPIQPAGFQIDLKTWPAAEYILNIVSADHKMIQSYTIIKQK
jgi:hypothetical protein